MKHVLVVGVDSIVGGNLANTLANHHHVTGLSATKFVQIANTNTRVGNPQTLEDVRRELSLTNPDLVVVCGPAAQSVWSMDNPEHLDRTALKAPVHWATAVAETEARLIVVSSDAVFHGPWMFHEEACTGVCQSQTASAIREMEYQVLQNCSSALIVRTNAFGWSPQSNGWIETLLAQIADEKPLRVPAANYATPIAAGQLAELLLQAWDRKLEGLYHVGGSERVNFVHFAHRLAQEFQLPRPKFVSTAQSELQHNFGQGETSMNSNRFRRAVGTALPMLGESLTHLREQSENGNRDQLQSDQPQLTSAAA
ncbi:MAG: sugar nucleotide-binding protein [Planctomycetaceae bacterium]|nr:sugar nucleotide-binding protein [Planctomycetaceae bacterium]